MFVYLTLSVTFDHVSISGLVPDTAENSRIRTLFYKEYQPARTCLAAAALGRCILSSYPSTTLTSQRSSDQRKVKEMRDGSEVLHVGASRLDVPEVRVRRWQRLDAVSYHLILIKH